MGKTFAFIGSERGYETIAKLRDLTKDTVHKDVIDRTYKILDILDAKANSLLRVNGLIITILVFLWGATRLPSNPLQISKYYLTVGQLQLVFVFLSVLFCFWIVRVNWRFLAHVHKKEANKPYEFDGATNRLANVLDDRTHLYWLAWSCTLLAVLLPPLSMLLAFLMPSVSAIET